MSSSYNGTELQSITWNGDDVQTVTMDGVEVWSASKPVGICLVQTGGGSGTWAWIDKDGNTTTNIDFNSTYPWSDIHDVTIDGQAMVYIPKFYLKTGTFASGTYSGKKYWIVSKTARDGFRIHPAFKLRGVEKNGVYVGKYIAYNEGANKAGSANGKNLWSNTRPGAISACEARNDGSATGAKAGWHLLTIYEWAIIQIMMLIEKKTGDMQVACGNGADVNISGSSQVNWRGIWDLWGLTWEWVDGITTDANKKFVILDNTNTPGQTVNTGLIHQSGWLLDIAENKGSNFDCRDLFLPGSVSSSRESSTFNDFGASGSNCAVRVGGRTMRGYYYETGLFEIANDYGENFNYSPNCGFRIAKYDI